MSLVRTGCFFLLFLSALKLSAQLPSTPEGIKQPRILILMDGSSSMLQPWNGNIQRFAAAGRVVSTLMDSIYQVNRNVEFALRVYGHQYPAQENNCTDTRREVMFSKDNYTQMSLRMASIRPSGVSPIAYALKEAATKDLENELYNAYSIILVTDGGESCNGDICDVVQTLIARKIFFKPYIISMIDYEPLRGQYACLGSMLTVAKEGDIPAAVSSIVNDYRPLLQLPILRATQPAPAPAKAPEVQTVVVPKWIPQHSSVSTLQVVVRDNIPQMYHYNPVIRPTQQPTLPMPRIEKETPPVAASVLPKKDTAKPAPSPTPVPRQAPPPVPATTTAVIRPLPQPKPAAAKPKANDNTKPNELSYTSSAETTTETGTLIYFTDGHGKFYKTTPRLQLKDARTGAVVKQFFRTVDASGNPDLQQLPGGTYSLIVPGRRNSFMRNVIIHADKLNKIVALVDNGSLAFQYEGAPDRTVEFDAVVNILFEPGPTIRQRCAQELDYPPGNYHIEVNTLPVTKYNTDIDFGSTTVIPIKQPGFVKFTNTSPVGKATLYYELGDQYARFHSLELKGDTSVAPLRLQPGKYEVHWMKTPAQPYARESVYQFQVKPNAVTELELH